MEAAHSPVGPSQLAIVRRCAGSVAMSYPFKDEPDTEEAVEGHAAHWVAFEMLFERPCVVGEAAPNGVIVTEEMIDGAELYRATVNEARCELEYIEQKIPVPRIHDACFGTPDYLGYSPTWAVIRATDYKFGHRYVDVYENEQLVAYVEGLIDLHQLDDQAVMVEFTIVQPRCYHPEGPVRRWKVRACDLRTLVNECAAQAEIAMKPGAPCKTGEHCRDCKGRRACATLDRAGGLLIDLVGSLEAITQSPEEVGNELRIIDGAIARLEALRTARAEQALQFLRSGKRVPHYEVGFSQPRDIWVKPVSEIKMLGELLDVALVTEEPCTPKQAIAKLKKKDIDGSVIKGYSETPRGAAKLIPASLVNAQKIFGAT